MYVWIGVDWNGGVDDAECKRHCCGWLVQCTASYGWLGHIQFESGVLGDNPTTSTCDVASTPTTTTTLTTTTFTMGVWQAALVKMGMAQPGPKITAQDRAVLECVPPHFPYHPPLLSSQVLTAASRTSATDSSSSRNAYATRKRTRLTRSSRSYLIASRRLQGRH